MTRQFHVAGPSGHLCVLRLNAEATVDDLKAAIEAQTEVSVDSQRLFHGLQELTGRCESDQLLRGLRELSSGGDDLLSLLPAEGCEHVELLLVRRSLEQLAWLEELEDLSDAEAAEWLRVAASSVQADKEIVLAVVSRRGCALQFASPELRSDREVVIAAVKQDWQALEFAQRELWKEREVVRAVVAQNREAVQFATERPSAPCVLL